MWISLRELFVLVTIFPMVFTERIHQSSNQLFHILNTLKPLRSQLCQFKFENCIQDSSYADQLDNRCNIYSRLRDCFRTLFDDLHCSNTQLKQQYRKVRENEYLACSTPPLHSSMHTSKSSTLSRNYLRILLLLLSVSLAFL